MKHYCITWVNRRAQRGRLDIEEPIDNKNCTLSRQLCPPVCMGKVSQQTVNIPFSSQMSYKITWSPPEQGPLYSTGISKVEYIQQ